MLNININNLVKQKGLFMQPSPSLLLVLPELDRQNYSAWLLERLGC